MPLIDIVAPGVEPVTPAEVKMSARIDGAEFDAQIPMVITTMRKLLEARTGRRLITQTVELVLDGFPCGEIDLQLPNVQSIVSVKYIDVSGVEQALASNLYSLDSASTPGWLLAAYDTSWPETMVTANAVRVRFLVGYGDAAAAVPEDLRYWIITHAAHEFGGSPPSEFVDAIPNDYKVWRV